MDLVVSEYLGSHPKVIMWLERSAGAITTPLALNHSSYAAYDGFAYYKKGNTFYIIIFSTISIHYSIDIRVCYRWFKNFCKYPWSLQSYFCVLTIKSLHFLIKMNFVSLGKFSLKFKIYY